MAGAVSSSPAILHNSTMAAIPTIKIQDGNGGFMVINARDFDEKTHKVYRENEPAKTTEAEAPATPKTRKAKV